MWYNKPMIWLLQSPLHGLLSKNTMLITVTGRKSGRQYTTPVNYVREGNTIWVISRRERTWWRNLRSPASVRLWLAGRDVTARAELLSDQADVAAHLGHYLRQMPMSGRSLGVPFENGTPDPAGLANAARDWLMIRIELEGAAAHTQDSPLP